jgi:NAD(P)-dependent dehydrogenase (short-subunit alcohol dehydrogenase family)
MSHPDTTLAAHLAHYPELAEHAKGWRHPFDTQALSDKVILVTGAGDGLGAATAKTYATFGATVVLLGRTRLKLEAVNDWISTNTATQPVIVPCDLETLDMETANNLAHSISEAFGRLDGIVHHASRLGPRAPLAHYALEEWLKVMQTNVNATFLLNQTLFNLLDASARACIVHTSSSVGRVGRAYWGAYAASKFALEGLSQVLADETEVASRIKVFSVNPGGTRTNMRKEAYPLEDPDTLPTPEAHMELFMLLQQPLRENGEAAELITGQQLDCRDWRDKLQWI